MILTENRKTTETSSVSVELVEISGDFIKVEAIISPIGKWAKTTLLSAPRPKNADTAAFSLRPFDPAFHVRFEQIHPCEDYNGRLGRLIMMKECLRHGIDPCIVGDKRCAAYHCGIAAWSTDHTPSLTTALEAQKRFQAKMEVCRLMQYARLPEDYR